MINEFLFLGSEDDLQNREFDYRSVIMIPSNSNVSRDLARPIYTLSFSCAILDKCINSDELALVQSTEENLFVVGQLQDYLIQQDENCYIDDVDVMNMASEDDNITSAMFDITISFARKNYNLGIDNA
tara:strand:+ start:3062 stop:3445 length:384 start_codon:yes stop_codon:yes gene_type:complete